MKLTLTQTTETGDLNGLACQVWEGQTDGGVHVVVFVALVAVSREAHAVFEHELGEAVPASSRVGQVLAALNHDDEQLDNNVGPAWPTRES